MSVRYCADCGIVPTTVGNDDDLAVCADCLSDRWEAEANVRIPEPATISPDDFELPGKALVRMTESFLATLTEKERAILETDPADSAPVTREKIEAAEHRALKRLRARLAKSKNPEET